MTAVNNHVPTGLNIAETSQNHVLIKWTGNKSFNYKYELLKYDADTETYVQFSPPLYVEGGVTHFYVPISLGDVTLKVRSVRLTDNVVSLISESSVSINWETILENNSTDYQKIHRHLDTDSIHFKMDSVVNGVASTVLKEEAFIAESGKNYIVDTSEAPVPATLPSSAVVGFTFHAYDGDAEGTWDVNNLVLTTEGDETINGSSSDYNVNAKGGHVMVVRKSLTDWFVRLAIFFFLLSGLSAEGRFTWEKNNIEMNSGLFVSVDSLKARSGNDYISVLGSDGTTMALFSTSGLFVETISVSDYYVTSYFNSLSFDEIDAVTADIDILNAGQSNVTTLVVDFSSMSDVDITTLTVGTMSVSTADITILQTERIMSGFFYSAFGELGITTDIIIDGNTLRFQSGLLTEINPE